MARQRIETTDQGWTVCIDFSREEIAQIGEICPDDSLVFALASIAVGVGQVAETAQNKRSVLKRVDRVIALAKQLDAEISELPALLRGEYGDATVLANIARVATLQSERHRKRGRPTAVPARSVLQAVAYQFRQRALPVTLSHEPESKFLGLVGIVCSACGIVVTVETLKRHAMAINLLVPPVAGLPAESGSGVRAIQYGAGRFEYGFDQPPTCNADFVSNERDGITIRYRFTFQAR